MYPIPRVLKWSVHQWRCTQSWYSLSSIHVQWSLSIGQSTDPDLWGKEGSREIFCSVTIWFGAWEHFVSNLHIARCGSESSWGGGGTSSLPCPVISPRPLLCGMACLLQVCLQMSVRIGTLHLSKRLCYLSVLTKMIATILKKAQSALLHFYSSWKMLIFKTI